MNYSITEVCDKTGLSAYTLRYYEKEGLLKDIKRTAQKTRCYTDKDLEILELICCLKNTGMPLSEIRHFINLTGEGYDILKERCHILVEHQNRVLAQIQEMQVHLDTVNQKIDDFSHMLSDYEKNQDMQKMTDCKERATNS